MKTSWLTPFPVAIGLQLLTGTPIGRQERVGTASYRRLEGVQILGQVSRTDFIRGCNCNRSSSRVNSILEVGCKSSMLLLQCKKPKNRRCKTVARRKYTLRTVKDQNGETRN